MKTKIIMLMLAMVLAASPVFGGSYTITTTAEEDAAILEEATKQGQTADEYMVEYMRNAVVPHVARLRSDKRANAWAGIQKACNGGDQAACGKVNAALSALGLQ